MKQQYKRNFMGQTRSEHSHAESFRAALAIRFVGEAISSGAPGSGSPANIVTKCYEVADLLVQEIERRGDWIPIEQDPAPHGPANPNVMQQLVKKK